MNPKARIEYLVNLLNRYPYSYLDTTTNEIMGLDGKLIKQNIHVHIRPHPYPIILITMSNILFKADT